jgi:NADH-quinone oxidoreductase subunit G
MVELTIDGKNVEVPEGSMVMHAAHKLGVYVPHFCYHKKLSIAANCRMCLVEVEKAPKALPACATPATNGMIVHTCSEKAVAAQKAVMEFLLINHPLDCPICDQGGECQLQDLAVGYGGSVSRYEEEKRVVFHKDLGPLVSAEEMSRCIHCTRCVRFGQEIAGVMELGMLNRGEHSEITTFVGRSIESELSGNMIDICPVGALTSKPFRYHARTWELARRKAVSPHDSLGTNLVVQVKRDEVLRVVPFENEEINECWISDRDRFAYEGLSQDRLTTPMIKGDDGVWQEANWADALQAVALGLSNVRQSMGAEQIGFVGSEQCTLEELSLLSRLAHGVGSAHVDARARLTDANWDQALSGVPSLGMPITELGELDRVLVIGSFMRADHPLMTQRLRQAVKRGTQVNSIDLAADDPLMPLNARMTVAPSGVELALSEVAVALAAIKGVEVPAGLAQVTASDMATRIAQSLASGANVAVLMGNAAVHASNAVQLAANAQWIAQQAGGKFGFLTPGANTVGAYLAKATPVQGGKTVHQMLSEPLAAYVVINLEPQFDTALGQVAVDTLKAAKFAVALTPYQSAAQDWAHVMLPIGPFTETSGTFVNAQGTPQSFKATVPPLGQSRPGWKVLRVLGNLLKLPEFDEESSEAVRDAVLTGGIASKLSNEMKSTVGLTSATATSSASPASLQRIADVSIYQSDAIVRRAHALQQTTASKAPKARVHSQTLAQLGIEHGSMVKVSSNTGTTLLEAHADDTLALDCIRLSVGFEQTAALGSVQATLHVERA